MSKEKQIEEMAKVIDDIAHNAYIENYDDAVADSDKIAKALYNAGYRKQSEGEWKGNGYLKHCSECGNVVNFNNVSRWLYNFCPKCGAKMKGGAE